MTAPKITVFYSDQMVSNPRSLSPSGLKPRLIMEHWRKHSIPMNIVAPEPATIDMLAQVHDRSFLGDLVCGRIDNGFGDRSLNVARSLPHVAGALVSAALFSLKTGKPSVAPVSGAHHAGFDYCRAFCSVNSIALAAVETHKVSGGTIGFFDGDAHEPCGVLDIRRRLGFDWLEVYSPNHEFGTSALAESFLAALPNILEQRFAKCKLLIFQAAGDVLDIDPLGAGWLTEQQIAKRDLIILKTMKRLRIPLCWLMGGGYSRAPDGSLEPVLRVHLNTVRACLEVESTVRASGRLKDGFIKDL